MRIYKNLKILVFLAIVIMSLGFYSAYTYSTFETSPSATLSSYSYNTQNICSEGGSDFVLQIDYLGCEKTPVRSDLLEDQNVVVLCPLIATKYNPLISIDYIDNIHITGQYPPEVLSVGFYPKNSALLSSLSQIELNSDNFASSENIGYVMITLKRQKNESAMPNYVEGNLTARISYDIRNAFGIGLVNYYLPVVSDKDWATNNAQYSFWGGKGYLRADSIEDNSASISVYYGLSGNTGQRKLSTINLNEGETSSPIYLPNVGMCLANFQIKLDSLEVPDTYARLRINDDYIELTKGSKFLDNKCTIKDVEKIGLVQKATITCRGDDKIYDQDLSISPQVNLTINGISKSYSVGDVIYEFAANDEKRIFLGYMGEDKEGNSFIVPVISPARTKEEFLDSKAYNKDVPLFVDTVLIGKGQGIGTEIVTGAVKSVLGNAGSTFGFLTSGTFPIALYYEGDKSFTGQDASAALNLIPAFSNLLAGRAIPPIQFDGYSILSDADIGKGATDSQKTSLTTYFSGAANNYDRVIESYSEENNYENPDLKLGEYAMYEKINFLAHSNQSSSATQLCEDFKKEYSDSDLIVKVDEYCKNYALLSSPELSSMDVLVDNRIKTINLEKVSEPSLEDYSADIIISGSNTDYNKNVKIGKNQRIYVSDSETIVLKELGDDYAIFDVTGVDFSKLSDLTYTPSNLKVKLDDFAIVGKNKYKIYLSNVNLKKLAKISIDTGLDRQYSETELNFKIGIEKRLQILTPSAIKSQINTLNDSIELFNKISSNLGSVVDGFQKSCLGVSSYFYFKNIYETLTGESSARQQIMRGSGGWYQRCNDEYSAGDYTSISACLLNNSAIINKQVSELSSIKDKQNEDIKILQDKYLTENIFGENTVDTDKFMQDYVPNVNSLLTSTIGDTFTNPSKTSESIDVANLSKSVVYSAWKEGKYSLSEIRDIDLYLRVLNSNPSSDLGQMAQRELYSDLLDLQKNTEDFVKYQNLKIESGLETSSSLLDLEPNKKSLEISITSSETFGSSDYASYGFSEGTPTIESNDFVYYIRDKVTGNRYLFVYDAQGVVLHTYKLDVNSRIISVYFKQGEEGNVNPYNVHFKKVSSDSYENVYKDPKASYYETAPYKGLPAVVPFDLKEGWYVATKSKTYSEEAINAYDKSGVWRSIYVCNVGVNGIQEFYSTGFGDDYCQLFNRDSSRSLQIPGLDASASSKIENAAGDALQAAQNQYTSGVNKIQVKDLNNKIITLKVGEPSTSIPDITCEDFMSPKECNVLANACDPVVCPASRCDFGGQYHVSDVIQSGIIGSTLLCLPNAKEGIYVPVCLTGIKSGLDGFISIQDSYRSCLQKNLETGQTVGLCDEVYSIYQCDFVWKQAAPLAKLSLSKAVSVLRGENIHGGGEYVYSQDILDNSKKLIDYLSKYYQSSSENAFKVTSTDQVGTEVCRNFVSAVYPDAANIANQLTETDSPYQAFGTVSEEVYTTATNPPTSAYKVFYHIYSGSNTGAYYSVYLKGNEGSSYYQYTSSYYPVDSGYIAVGDYATDTKDFTAFSGYSQLCIDVNGKEDCGVGSISTSFASKYIQDAYVSQQANTSDIKTTAECVSGKASLYDFLNVNLQSSISSMVDPQIYDYDVTRICSTQNPGKATTEESRWLKQGYCDDEAMGCWLDIDGLKGAFNFLSNSNRTLSDLTSQSLNSLAENGDYITTDAEFGTILNKIKSENSLTRKINVIDNVIDRVVLNNQKGYLYLLKAEIYSDLFKTLKSSISVQSKNKDTTLADEPLATSEGEGDNGASQDDGLYGGLVHELSLTENNPYKILEFGDGTRLSKNLFYSYDDGRGWLVTNEKGDDRTWYVVSDLVKIKNLYDSWQAGGDNPTGDSDITLSGYTFPNIQLAYVIVDSMSLSEDEIYLFNELDTDNYLQGIGDLVQTVILDDNENTWTNFRTDYSLSTDNVHLNSKGEFSVVLGNNDKENTGISTIYLSFSDEDKFWNVYTYDIPSYVSQYSTSNEGGDILSAKINYINTLPEPFDKLNIVDKLRGVGFYEGSFVILSGGSPSSDFPSSPSSSVGSSSSCPLKGECQVLLGNKIIQIANEIKSNHPEIKDSDVWSQTGSKNFECLALQIAMTETQIQHCAKYKDESGNPLYCDGNANELITGDKGASKGVMQINTNVHTSADYANFEGNVKYALENVLIPGYVEYEDTSKKFQGNGEVYSGWLAAVRGYNGWGTTGNNNYVSDVINKNENIKSMFSYCGEGYVSSNYLKDLSTPQARYDELSSVFQKYASQNLPSGWIELEFQAILISIAEEETNIGYEDNIFDTGFLMNYNEGNEKFKGADNQISYFSGEIKSALEKKNEKYSECDSEVGEEHLVCILSVSKTGKTPGRVWGILWNNEGQRYADRIMEQFDKWKVYLGSGAIDTSSTISEGATRVFHLLIDGQFPTQSVPVEFSAEPVVLNSDNLTLPQEEGISQIHVEIPIFTVYAEPIGPQPASASDTSLTECIEEPVQSCLILPEIDTNVFTLSDSDESSILDSVILRFNSDSLIGVDSLTIQAISSETTDTSGQIPLDSNYIDTLVFTSPDTSSLQGIEFDVLDPDTGEIVDNAVIDSSGRANIDIVDFVPFNFDTQTITETKTFQPYSGAEYLTEDEINQRILDIINEEVSFNDYCSLNVESGFSVFRCAQYVTTSFDYIFGHGKSYVEGVIGNAWGIPQNMLPLGGQRIYNRHEGGEPQPNFKDFDSLKVGDILGLYSQESHFLDEAITDTGENYTHVGLYLGKIDGEYIVTHKIGPKTYVDAINTDYSSVRGWGIETVLRPNQDNLYLTPVGYKNKYKYLSHSYKVLSSDNGLGVVARHFSNNLQQTNAIIWFYIDEFKTEQVNKGQTVTLYIPSKPSDFEPIISEVPTSLTQLINHLKDISGTRFSGLDGEQQLVEWGNAIKRGFVAANMEPTDENYALVFSIIDKESGFNENPSLNMTKVCNEILTNTNNPDSTWTSRQACRFYSNDADSIGTEKDYVNSIFQKGFLGIGGKKLTSAGAMQINIATTMSIAKSEGSSMTEDEMYAYLFTKQGGIEYGLKYLKSLLDVYAPDGNLNKENVGFIFADYNAGLYRSRNAAFQNWINEIIEKGQTEGLYSDVEEKTGISRGQLNTDGYLGENTAEMVEYILNRDVSLSNGRIPSSEIGAFENTIVYHDMKEKYVEITGNNPSYAIIPSISSSSIKYPGVILTLNNYVSTSMKNLYNYCRATTDCISSEFA